MKSVSICHAPQDVGHARELARFIEVNFGFDVSTDDAAITPERDLATALQCALSASIAVLLASPASVPGPLKREVWQQIFVNAPAEYKTPFACVLLSDCAFPPILRRGERFFDGSTDFLAGSRALKRWMITLGPRLITDSDGCSQQSADRAKLDLLWTQIVDAPGSAEGIDAKTAAALVHETRADFEGVFRVPCHGRRLELILGELARAVGLRQPGPVEENRNGLAWHCAAHRYLIVFEDAAPETMERLRFGGRCSVLFSTGAARQLPAAPVEITYANLAEAMDYTLELLPRDEETGGQLAWRIIFLLSEQGRYAEADLLLDAMQRAGCAHVERMARERAWIHAQWGESVEIPSPPIRNAMQLDLFGDGGWLGI